MMDYGKFKEMGLMIELYLNGFNFNKNKYLVQSMCLSLICLSSPTSLSTEASLIHQRRHLPQLQSLEQDFPHNWLESPCSSLHIPICHNRAEIQLPEVYKTTAI
jgi:hypothetical protein